MNFMKTLTTLVPTIILISCSHTVTFKQISTVSSRNSSGKIDVYEKGEKVEHEYKTIGSLWLGESGFSESCGYEDALFLSREKARELGADAVKVYKINKPDFTSTCYRVGVYIIEYREKIP